MITIGICDDDLKMLEQLENMIGEMFPEIVIRTFPHPDELEQYLHNEEGTALDIMIMDIVFEQGNGIQAAKRIQRMYPKIQLIYLTGYIDYARDIFESDPVYFLVKPVEREKLYNAIVRAKEKSNVKEQRYIIVNTRAEVNRVYYDDIIYVESERRNLHIHINHKCVTYINQLASLEKELPAEFIRIHQSYLVNMNYISSFGINNVELSNGMILPVSRHRNKSAKEKFMRYIGELV